MCIVALAWKILDDIPLLLISNRDEFYARPSTPLAKHTGTHGSIYCGTDLTAHGSWMGVTDSGRWAVITNYRDGSDKTVYATSRGTLVSDYLDSDSSPVAYARQLQATMMDYAGFNLIIGDRHQAVYLSNRGDGLQVLPAGVHIVSNNLMSEHWHKCSHLRTRFTQEILPLIASLNSQGSTIHPDIPAAVWQVLEDSRTLPDDKLPETGISKAWERTLSATFIKATDKGYGTRVSNLMMQTSDGLHWLEKQQVGERCGEVVAVSGDLV